MVVGRAIHAACARPRLERFQKLDIAPGGGTPAEVAAFVKEETRRWGEVIRAANITPV